MVYLKKNCNFPRFQRGWGLSIFPGGEGSNLLQGGGGAIAYFLYPYNLCLF